MWQRLFASSVKPNTGRQVVSKNGLVIALQEDHGLSMVQACMNLCTMDLLEKLSLSNS